MHFLLLRGVAGQVSAKRSAVQISPSSSASQRDTAAERAPKPNQQKSPVAGNATANTVDASRNGTVGEYIYIYIYIYMCVCMCL